MKFELEKFHRGTSEEDLITDLKAADAALASDGQALTFRSYNETGKYASSTITARFGSWNEALKRAGLNVREEKNVSDKDLFLNLENVWISLGRQPVIRDLVKPHSRYSYHIYNERFGGWRKALVAFVTYINESEPDTDEGPTYTVPSKPEKSLVKRRTSRAISDRMRFRVLSRDGFTCQSCGASPIKERGIELHVDHILPWSKGGETTEENLQTKCKQCNLGKGNAFNQ
jgi:hypothetical protein